VNRKILLTVLALSVVLLATPYIGMVHAKPSTTVSGTITVIPSGFPSEEKPAGSNNMIWTIAITEQWSGDIGGIGGTDESIWVWHHSFPPNVGPDFTINIHEKLTFPDVTVLGSYSGSMTMEVVLKVDITGLSGHWTILSGTDGLANLHGQGTISGPTSPYSYTGQVHFGP